MNVLVTGAGGFLGRYVVARLLERGHGVRALIRPASRVPAWHKDVEVIRSDLRIDKELASMFDDIDALLHVASATSGSEEVQFASTVVGTERLLEAMAKSSTRKLLLVSSFAVYDWSLASEKIDENTPLISEMYEMGAYTIAKMWQERVVTKFSKLHDWDLTVMRPGFIWGPGHAQIAAMGRRVGSAYVMFGPFSRLPLTHVVNCADCLVAAIEKRESKGQTFNVIDNDQIRVWRYVREYAKRSHQNGIMIPVPYRLGMALANVAVLVSRILYGKKGKLPSLLTPRRFEAQFKPVRFSSDKLMSVLGWSPPLGFEECLKQTYTPETLAGGLRAAN